jgi:hypothetical protein
MLRLRAPASRPLPCRSASAIRSATSRRARRIFPFAHRRHEDRAHTRRLAVRQRPVEFLKRLPRPEDLFELVQLARNLRKDTHLSATMAQVQIDAPTRPSMTSLTTKPACMKSDQRVTSLVAASPTCSIHIPSNPYARSIYRAAKTSLLPGIQKCAIAAFSLSKSSRGQFWSKDGARDPRNPNDFVHNWLWLRLG